MRAVAQRMMAFSNLPKLPRVMAEMTKAVHTDIAAPDLVYLAKELRHATGENIRVATLPGEPRTIRRISYFIPFEKQIKELVAETFDLVDTGGPATVEVLNGSGRRGLASRFARRLEESGFKVVRVANADRGDYSTSRVVYRTPDSDGAEEIVSLLGTGQSEPGSDREAGAPEAERRGQGDITVIVGRDYADTLVQ
jgi:hypothetical protein